jgi:hypothetical protein
VVNFPLGIVMGVGNYRIPKNWGPKTRVIGVILVIAFVGPVVGLLLAAFGIVLAPPWTFLTSLIYLPIVCLGLPVGIVAILMGWIPLPLPNFLGRGLGGGANNSQFSHLSAPELQGGGAWRCVIIALPPFQGGFRAVQSCTTITQLRI